MPQKLGRKLFSIIVWLVRQNVLFTENAISVKAILHAEHSGKLCMCPENGWGDL